MRSLSQGDAERVMLGTPSIINLQHFSKLYSSGPHLAGDLAHAEAIRDLWRSYGIDAHLLRYDVLQNFPCSSSLTLHSPSGGVALAAGLTEDAVPEDPTSAPANGLPAFHGFGANGTVNAELVYANFGMPSDFALLKSHGIDVAGKIVICKYAKNFRGLKVRAAQQAGAAGVLLYNDPQEDGEYTAQNGYAYYPHGPARHPKSVQRGSVDFFSVAVGDPSTPGWPSLPGRETKRADPRHAIPTIPSLPISFTDALPFLKALNGQGGSPEELGVANGDWCGKLEGIGYWSGPSKVKVTLHSHSNYRYSPIYNVIGEVPGSTEESVILGSHHDSWSCGAVDPVSGSVALNEVARGLGQLAKMKWKPYRKMQVTSFHMENSMRQPADLFVDRILASWDNEEYGLIGSTEYGEQFADVISNSCVAYINVDESTNGGKYLGATGSPLLTKVLNDVTKLVPSPVNLCKSVFDDWYTYQVSQHDKENKGDLVCMGTGSDYTVFFHHLGIPSLDLVFNKAGESVYPYHSNYDSFYWLQNFGDPGFKKHLAMAQLWGVLAVRLAGVPLLQFDATDYGRFLRHHLKNVQDYSLRGLNLRRLQYAVSMIEAAARALDKRATEFKERQSRLGLQELNQRYLRLERAFLLHEGDGLPGRLWYRHPISAPGLWYGYDGVVFPGIVEGMENEDIETAQQWVGRTAMSIERATESLAIAPC
ncbi:Zn-dependent exopeptidase [Xylariaceae sp. FL0016]|nr:Zn-dependent exopeptidase [Xylariaceae sp. FL0016]